MDVYRGRIKAERSLPHFLLFILFFPHLVAGPIVRGRDFLPQIAPAQAVELARGPSSGVQLILLGLFKKLAIADRMALFATPSVPGQDVASLSTSAAWMAVLAYAIHIYCDFSGYSDMALGSAHLLGYKLIVNFNMPYLAANITEFWRRWHICLSTWLRDYLFIPLGGSRGGFWFTASNLMITMALGGLWHGATWCWLVWGLLHAFMLIVHRAFRQFAEARPTLKWALETRPGTVLRILVTLFFVTLSMAFAQPSLEKALSGCAKDVRAGKRAVAADGPKPALVDAVPGGLRTPDRRARDLEMGVAAAAGPGPRGRAGAVVRGRAGAFAGYDQGVRLLPVLRTIGN